MTSAETLRRRVLVAALVALAASPRLAHALDKVACMSAAESSEDLRKTGKLRDARDKLAVCAQPACPAFVRTDCKKWLGEVTASIASVALRVDDVGGKPVSNVVVSVDDVKVADEVRAAPPWTVIELDPGTHTLRVVQEGNPAVDQSVTVKPGEKQRQVKMQLAPAPPAPPAPPESASSPPPPASSPSRPVPVPVYVLAGAGVLAAGVGTFFQVSGMSKVSALDKCKPSCAPSSRDDARTTLWIGNVGLGVGAAALVTAGVLFILRPTAEPRPTPLGLRFDVRPTRDGAFGVMEGTL